MLLFSHDVQRLYVVLVAKARVLVTSDEAPNLVGLEVILRRFIYVSNCITDQGALVNVEKKKGERLGVDRV